MRILVTGGAGFIGSHVCEHLVRSDHDVVVLDDLSTGLPSNIEHLPVTFIEGSITTPSAVHQAMEGVHAVAHLAALGSVPRSIDDPATAFHTNAVGTLNVLEAARAHGAHVTFASSSSVYGSVPTLPRTEDLPTRPISPYGASKLAAESLVLAYTSAYTMRNVALRFFNVYGPRQRPDGPYAAVIPRFINAALTGSPIDIHGTGEQSRDFTYVDTVARVVEQALTRQDLWRSTPINLAFGTTTSINEMASTIEQILGLSLERRFTPNRPGDIDASTNDPSRLLADFPGITDVRFVDGLRKTTEWFSSTANGRHLFPGRTT